MILIEQGTCTDYQLSNQTPLYVSKRSFKNLWQQYRIYPDRIELQCWITIRTLKIPLHEIVDIKIRSPFSFGDLFRRGSLSLRGTKIDQADFCRHILMTKKSGLLKHIAFTPDNPEEFASIIMLLMKNADVIKLCMENNKSV